MSSNEIKCKLAYAADGTLICDPKKYIKKPIFNYEGSPINMSCSPSKCTIYNKSCSKENNK